MMAPMPPGFLCPTLIGRQHDLTALQVLIERKRRGAGQAILISGEAGMGKSRLVAEAKIYAAHQGFLLLEGQCFQRDRAYPYAPLLDLFRAYFSRSVPSGLADHLHTFVSTLSRLLPDLVLLFPDLAASPTLPSSDPAEEQRRIFAAMTHFLTEQATQHPILLVVEDVHWSDDLSLDFLLHLARRARHLPLLVLVTYRSEALHPGLRHWLSQLDRERLTQGFPLGPLSQSEVDDMVRAILAGEHSVDADLLDTLYTLSEGNPFFVEELLKSLVATGELQCVEGRWVLRAEKPVAGGSAFIPRSVQEVIHQRVDQVSVAARQVLTLAAVAGRRFDFPVLQQALHCDEDDLLNLIKELMAAQLVVEKSADQFAFRHALTQQVISSQLLARERRSLHRTIAEALEQLVTSAPLREQYLADLAYHCSEAGSWAKAQEYEQAVGERALALYAPGAAVEHLTRAEDAAQHLHLTPPAQVYHARGQAYHTLGEFVRAQSDYERALAAAHVKHDIQMQWQAMMALGFLWTERDYAQAGAWFRYASDEAARVSEPTLQARSLNRLGNWLVNTGQAAEGLRAHQEALALFEGLHDRQGMAEAHDLLATAFGQAGDRVTALHHLAEAIALFRALGDTPHLVSSLAMRANQSISANNETTLYAMRTREAGVEDAMESLHLARQSESLSGQAFAEMTLSQVLLSFGELGSALAHAQEALRIATAIGHRQWLVATHYSLGHLYLRLLAPSQALAELETGLEVARALDSAFWMGRLSASVGWANILKGDLPAAEAALNAVMPPDHPPRTVVERYVAWMWGELALAQGEPDLAFQMAEQLLSTIPGQRPQQDRPLVPHLLKLQGEALVALSRLEDAVQVLEEAKQGATLRQDRSLLWTVHRSLAQAYLRLRREEDSRDATAQAQAIIEELAATLTDAGLQQPFKRKALTSLPRVTPLSRRAAAKRAFGGLTAREQEVAALIAQGKTSREIARLLVVSERTAEVHVSNILGKLGFTSRAQVAAWAVEKGLAKQ